VLASVSASAGLERAEAGTVARIETPQAADERSDDVTEDADGVGTLRFLPPWATARCVAAALPRRASRGQLLAGSARFRYSSELNAAEVMRIACVAGARTVTVLPWETTTPKAAEEAMRCADWVGSAATLSFCHAKRKKDSISFIDDIVKSIDYRKPVGSDSLAHEERPKVSHHYVLAT
jgi:hypothetical protein